MVRIALYLGKCHVRRDTLRSHFMRAQASGRRIVTMVQERPQATGLRPVLGDLIDRMGDGEFEMIETVVDFGVSRSGKPRHFPSAPPRMR